MTPPAIERRTAPRANDTGWRRYLGIAMRYRGLLSWLTGGSVGAGLMALLMRFFVVTQLHAQADVTQRRFAADELRMDLYERRLPKIESAITTLLNDACFRYTRAEQTARAMDCPDTIYKGAPE